MKWTLLFTVGVDLSIKSLVVKRKRLQMEGAWSCDQLKFPFVAALRQYGNALLSKISVQQYRNEIFSGRIGDETPVS